MTIPHKPNIILKTSQQPPILQDTLQDWGFKTNEIRIPTFIWHGEKDTNVPHEWALKTKEEIHNSQLKVLPNEGHLLIFKHAEEIFATLK